MKWLLLAKAPYLVFGPESTTLFQRLSICCIALDDP
jgi:hypothetical protein